jgi:hypothetical protein
MFVAAVGVVSFRGVNVLSINLQAEEAIDVGAVGSEEERAPMLEEVLQRFAISLKAPGVAEHDDQRLGGILPRLIHQPFERHEAGVVDPVTEDLSPLGAHEDYRLGGLIFRSGFLRASVLRAACKREDYADNPSA